MASELRVNTLKDAAGNNSIATSFVAGGSAKAWVFATDNTITNSLNTSSSSDEATGQFRFNLSSAMGNTTYAMTGTVNENDNLIIGNKQRTASSYDIRIKNASNSGTDANTGSAIHGDLA